MLILDDPSSVVDYGNQFEPYFLMFYVLEMCLKIFGLGLISTKTAYLRNGWNILDVCIILPGVVNLYYSSNTDVKFSALRIFRVLRPLKTISALKNLKKIISTLLTAFPMIMNEILIVMFWLMMNAIVGVQLLAGVLKKRCFDKTTGLMITQMYDNSYNGILCGYDSCPDDKYICGKMMDNPNFNITNFDSFLWSLLMMFQGITLENWSVNMYYCVMTFSYYIVVFFISLAFVGSYILMNILVSIIIKAYKEVEEKVGKGSKKEENEQISLNEMKTLKIYDQENYKRISLQEVSKNNISPLIKIEEKTGFLKNFKKKILGFFLVKIPGLMKKNKANSKELKKLEKSRKSILINQIQRLMDTKQTMFEKNLIKNSGRSNFLKNVQQPSFLGKRKEKLNSELSNNLQLFEKVKINSYDELSVIKENNKDVQFYDKSDDLLLENTNKPLMKPEERNVKSKKIHNRVKILPNPEEKNQISINTSPKLYPNIILNSSLTEGEHSVKKKFKITKILSQMLDYKLMVDHNQRYESTSNEDIMPDIKARVMSRENKKLFEEMKKAHKKIEYILYKIPSKYLKIRKKCSKGGFKLAMKRKFIFLMKNIDFSDDFGKGESSGCLSPSKQKKGKTELRLNSYRVSYDYISFKLNEAIQKDNAEEEKKFCNEQDFYEINVIFYCEIFFSKIFWKIVFAMS